MSYDELAARLAQPQTFDAQDLYSALMLLRSFAASELSFEEDAQPMDFGLQNLAGIVVNDEGIHFVSDCCNHVIRMISSDGSVSTYAGKFGEPGQEDGVGEEAKRGRAQ